jgi:hypothetical protein
MTKNIGLVIPILCRLIVFPGREQRREKLFVSAVPKEDRLLTFSDWKILTFFLNVGVLKIALHYSHLDLRNCIQFTDLETSVLCHYVLRF